MKLGKPRPLNHFFVPPARKPVSLVPLSLVLSKKTHQQQGQEKPPEQPKGLLPHGIGAITSQGDGSDVFSSGNYPTEQRCLAPVA